MPNLGDYAKMNDAELLQAQAHIWYQTFTYIKSMSLKCAVELGIPDIIHSHGKPITVSELNEALSIHPTKAYCLPRLMRILVHSGIFALAKTNQNDDKEEQYVLTNSSRLLLKDNPFSPVPLMLINLNPVITNPFHSASQWLFNDDRTVFDTYHGMSIWDYTARDQNLNNLFNKGMSSDARLVISVLVNQRKEVFDGLNSVVDVGGGTGTAAKIIAEAFPHIHFTVLDLPQVVAGCRDTHNFKFIGGSMFDGVPPADAILLKSVLHNWSDEACLKVLEECKKAIKGRKGGKVIVIDMVREIEKETNEDINETHLFIDMLMMIDLAGKERSEKEWAKLFSDAGFSGYKISPILGLRSLIEVYP